ncbi:DUF547 domain-containing protein [Kiloniella antarctica]|uniref:DUF547 domain-containing protein n=1 Tax=Kiloniella antarctica TaxID=1550907 RepID=A0ABW5BKZ8_9PROT
MNRKLRILILPIIVMVGILVSGFGSFDALFTPSAESIPRWTASDPKSTTMIQNRNWNHFLKTYREESYDGIARIAYHRISLNDRLVLRDYIRQLQGISVSKLNRKEQLAYWVNLYNATTVQLVLEHMPIESIRDIDISPGLFASGPWDKKILRVEGEKLSLNDIEHGILRPGWKDPRIHYVLNCASLGCPDIPKKALTAQDSENQLSLAATRFIDHPRAITIPENNEAVVSSIYIWFKKDFGGSDAAILDHMRTFASKKKKKRLMNVRSLESHRYDWDLNAVPVVATASAGS